MDTHLPAFFPPEPYHLPKHQLVHSDISHLHLPAMSLRTGTRSLRRTNLLASARAAAALPPQPSRCASTSSPASPLEPEARTQRTNPAPGPPKPNSPFTIFDRPAKVMQRDRAARKGEASRQTDYVRKAAAENVAERVLDIKRQFDTIVEIGSGPGYLRQFLDKEGTGVRKIIMCDTSREMLYRDEHLDGDYPFEIERRIIDEEELPFEPNSLECVVSSGALHWTNDLPGALVQIQRSLKPDGCFVGSMYGGDTLFELRTSMQLAEQEREGGISPRVSPMTDTRDCASLLSRAGFSIPTVDIDEISVAYPSMYELIHDLRDMGESNAVINRRPLLRRDTLLAAGAIYQALHGEEGVPQPDGSGGSIPATFGMIFLIGWKPDPSQAKPLERGSASHSMKDILGEGENPDSPEGPLPQGGVPPPPGGGKTRSFSTSARSRQQATTSSNSDPLPEKACSACGTIQPLASVVCPNTSCSQLQPLPSDLDFYTLLDLDFSSIPRNGWDVDVRALKNTWRKKQAVSHPDRMSGRSDKEKVIAQSQSALINKAFETLNDPLARANYLVSTTAVLGNDPSLS